MKKLIAALSILSTVTLFAGTNDTLTQFSAGTPAKAAEVNSNFKKLADIIDSMQATITQLQTQMAKQEMPIGTIIATTLTEAQMKAKYPNDEWVLAKGGASNTEFYAATTIATIPDLRGVVLRGKDNGKGLNPDGEIGLGVYQEDMYAKHVHETFPNSLSPSDSTNTGAFIQMGGTAGHYQAPGYVAFAGGNETRMKNVTVNFFIKVK